MWASERVSELEGEGEIVGARGWVSGRQRASEWDGE